MNPMKRILPALVLLLSLGHLSAAGATAYWSAKNMAGGNFGLRGPYVYVDTNLVVLGKATFGDAVGDTVIFVGTKWSWGGTWVTGTAANLNALVDSLVSSYAWRSKLTASDGSPNPAVSVDAAGATTLGGVLYVAAGNAAFPGITIPSDPNTGIFWTGGDSLAFTTAGAERMRIGLGGSILIGQTTANTKMTGPGLTIDGGGSDDEALTLKSTDVNQPWTDNSEATTFARMAKITGDGGGLTLIAYSDAQLTANYPSLQLIGLTTIRPDSTHGTGSLGVVNLGAQLTNGATGVTPIAAKGNIFTVTNSGAAQFIISGDGTTYSNLADSVFDAYDDPSFLRTYGAVVSPNNPLIDSTGVLRYNEDDLVRAGVLTARRSEGGLTNNTRLAMLMAGTMYQQAKGLENYGRIHSDIHDKANVVPVDTAAVVEAFKQIGPPRRYNYKPSVFTDPAQIERARQDTAKSTLDRIVAEKVGKLVQARTIQVIDHLDTTWSKQAVPTDSMVTSYKVTVDSAGVAGDAKPIYTHTKWDTVRIVAKVDTVHKAVPGVVSTGEAGGILDSVRFAQLGKVKGSLANSQTWIDAQAAKEHVSLVAQEVAPAISALTGAPADTTEYDLRDLVHAQQVVIQAQGREIETLKARLDGIEERLAKVETR